MRILFGYRYGIVGGVCSQLASRMAGWSGPRPTFAFVEFHGGEALVAPYGEVARMDSAAFARAAPEHDAVVVIDTPEYLDAVSSSNCPVLLEVHTTTERGLGYLEGRSFLGDGIAAPSRASADLLERRFGITGVEVIGNVVDVERFTAQPPRGGLPKRPILGWVGKLDGHKNWEGFLQLAALAAHGGHDVEAWMVGGYTAHEPVVRSLLETVAALELHPRFRWLPKIPYSAMPAFYAAVRATRGVMVSTTRNESFGMSVAEALAAELPVVAPAVGALPELAPSAAPYLALYPSGSLGDALQRIRSLIGSSPERRSAAVRLRLDRPELIRPWTPSVVTERFTEVLSATVASRRPT
ncbi:MAG: glycosyltransferase family 4 protein [Myxococcota bacterium]